MNNCKTNPKAMFASFNLINSVDQYAMTIDKFVVAWSIGNEHNLKAFDTFDQAEQFLYTQVPPASCANYRFISGNKLDWLLNLETKKG